MTDFIQNISNLLIALQVVMTAVVVVVAWSMRKAFVTRSEFEEHAGEIGKRLTMQSERLVIGDGRFDRIEDRMRTLPSAKEIAALQIAIERLTGDVRVLNEKIEGFEALHNTLREQVRVMDDFLRKTA